jgi:hypothetical protein
MYRLLATIAHGLTLGGAMGILKKIGRYGASKLIKDFI